MAHVGEFIRTIRTAMYGKEVRSSLADGLHAVNQETETTTVLSNETKHKQFVLEKKYDDQIANMTNENPSNSEVVDFRTSGITGKTFPTAGKRADAVDTQFVEMEKRMELQKYYVNVKEFGAKGDGIHDDTEAFQKAIDALGDYRYKHPNPWDITNPGGGVILIPKTNKYYKITRTLKYKSAMSFEGQGWGTIIKFEPVLPLNLFETDRTKYSAHNSHHDVKFERLVFVGDRLNKEGAGQSLVGLDILNTRYARVTDCVVTGFQTGIKMYRDNTDSYGYFNTIQNCYCYDNILNVEVATNGTQLIGGEFSNNYGWNNSDYMLKITAAGVIISGTTIEGSPKIAQVSDKGFGTSYTGNYSETTQGDVIGQKPFVEVDVRGGFTSLSLQGIYLATINSIIKFKNLFTSNDATKSYDVNYGVSLNSPGQYIETLKNTNFRNHLYAWTPKGDIKAYNRITYDDAYLFGGRFGVRVVKTDSSEKIIYQNAILPTKQAYVTAICKVTTRNPNDIMFRAWGFGEEGAQYGSPVCDFGDGWFLMLISLSNLQDPKGTIAVGIKENANIGTGMTVTSVQTYTGGFPIFPPYKLQEIESDHKPRWYGDGYYYVNDEIKNTKKEVYTDEQLKKDYFIDSWHCKKNGFGLESGQQEVAEFLEKRCYL